MRAAHRNDNIEEHKLQHREQSRGPFSEYVLQEKCDREDQFLSVSAALKAALLFYYLQDKVF